MEERQRRVLESLTSVGDGLVVSRGATEIVHRGSRPASRSPGLFDDGEVPSLLEGPVWTTLTTTQPPGGADEDWCLDLYSGLLHHRLTASRPRKQPWLTSTRFVSSVRPGVCCLRSTLAVSPGDVEPALALPRPAGSHGRPTALARLTGSTGVVTGSTWSRHGTLAAAGTQTLVPTAGPDPGVEVTRLVVYRTGPTPEAAEHRARLALREARAIGMDGLLDEHRRGWRQRWVGADVEVAGDPDLTLSLRFALFHLMSGCPVDGRRPDCALGARGATGPAYHGHVFWDTDVFVQPALAAFLPAAARATLLYRYNRLDAARRIAADHGRRGARFPWESAADGDDVTPRWAPDLHGGRIPILTGELEEHISADVAWAAAHYRDWVPDEDFARRVAPPLLVETARYWASRIETGEDGAGHISHVIGPDEYHEGVDDNAYTNLMVRRNLDLGAEELERDPRLGEASEAEHWRGLARTLVTGFRPDWGGYEQFTGWSELQDVPVATLGRPPLAADLLLGHDQTGRTRIIKQADVLMAHHLIPSELEPGALEVDIDRYLPYTAHGSSLSPAIHASVLARAGRTDTALELLAIAARLDLDDITGTTSGGLHTATMGGLLQAMLFGFLGAAPRGPRLGLEPAIPRRWREVTLRMRFGGRLLALTAAPSHLRVKLCQGEQLGVEVGPGPDVTATAAAGTILRFERRDSTWERAL
ncbi:MAG TPA: glycoside hydrolase family 65 protein [Acidimicrobiales bacterium]|nr:glycoside hydrolase family 65 protein [Acidimicrobiales bacterium]